jgi:hypothetical protein
MMVGNTKVKWSAENIKLDTARNTNWQLMPGPHARQLNRK